MVMQDSQEIKDQQGLSVLQDNQVLQAILVNKDHVDQLDKPDREETMEIRVNLDQGETLAWLEHVAQMAPLVQLEPQVTLVLPGPLAPTDNLDHRELEAMTVNRATRDLLVNRVQRVKMVHPDRMVSRVHVEHLE